VKHAALAIAAITLLTGVTSASAGRIPEARAMRACAGAGPFWPTMTLALSGRNAWVACKEQARLVRMTLPSGRKTATVQLDGPVIAVAVGLGSVWALDSGSTLYRLSPRTARITKRIQTGASAAYNIWIGGGAVWVADDQGARVLRISPAANKVVARISVGDGPADMAFAGTQAWVVAHRVNTLFRIDMRTNLATRLAIIEGNNAAAERIALLGDSLWVTGRGVPLVEVDPETGVVRRSVDISGTGIDVVATADALWVPVRTAAVDRRGFPTMTAVRRVTTAGSVTTVATARGRVDVHGLAVGLGSVWVADNTGGFLYRLPT
jgi:DNA-binding beta-propeller fold protein YncE